jgi:hypothetical protein
LRRNNNHAVTSVRVGEEMTRLAEDIDEMYMMMKVHTKKKYHEIGMLRKKV